MFALFTSLILALPALACTEYVALRGSKVHLSTYLKHTPSEKVSIKKIRALIDSQKTDSSNSQQQLQKYLENEFWQRHPEIPTRELRQIILALSKAS